MNFTSLFTVALMTLLVSAASAAQLEAVSQTPAPVPTEAEIIELQVFNAYKDKKQEEINPILGKVNDEMYQKILLAAACC